MNDYLSKPFQPETLKNKIVSNIELEGFTQRVITRPKAETNGSKVIDLTYLREVSGNDMDFITDMVQSFIRQSPVDIKKIWSHYSNNELEDIANLVHKIKPAITFMGIHQLKDLAPEIEDLAKNKSAEMLKTHLEEFERIYQEAIVELKQEFDLVE